MPLLLEKLAAGRSLKGAVVTIDAIACNPWIAQSIRDAGADYLLAVKGNQPALQADIAAAFDAADKGQVEVDVDLDKGHGRIETRTVSVLRQVDWLDGDRRFPGEVRFVDARAIVRVEARTELKDRSRFDVRYSITSSARSAAGLGHTIRCTGRSTSPSRRTCRACATATEPKTWRSCASSPSTGSAPPPSSATRPTSPSNPADDQAAPTQKPQAPKKNRQLGRQQGCRNPHSQSH